MQNNNKKASSTTDITMKSELKKVVWPTGKQTMKSTATTILFVVMLAAILIILDLVFNKVSKMYYEAVLGTEFDAHDHEEVLSGDVSGDLEKILEDLLSGDNSGDVSGEVVSGEQAE